MKLVYSIVKYGWVHFGSRAIKSSRKNRVTSALHRAANRDQLYIYREILMDYSAIFPFRISFLVRICFFPRLVPFLSILYIAVRPLSRALATGTNRNFSGRWRASKAQQVELQAVSQKNIWELRGEEEGRANLIFISGIKGILCRANFEERIIYMTSRA